MVNKPTLLQLREKYGINTVVLAEAAGVSPDVVYFMLVGRPVEQWEAACVLHGLTKLIDIAYRLEDIEVVIKS